MLQQVEDETPPVYTLRVAVRCCYFCNLLKREVVCVSSDAKVTSWILSGLPVIDATSTQCRLLVWLVVTSTSSRSIVDANVLIIIPVAVMMGVIPCETSNKLIQH